MKCETCGLALLPDEDCPSCALYNAAVEAQQAAARRIACAYSVDAHRPWLNDHGVFAWIGDETVQVGSPEQAAPFVALTTEARKVTSFRRRDRRERAKNGGG